jgi:hypothetical protein
MFAHSLRSLRSCPALVALLVACSSTTPASNQSKNDDAGRGDQGGQGAQSGAQGLTHKIVLVPADVQAGQNVEIQSTVTNTGTNAITLQSRICGLDLEGDLSLSVPIDIMTCGGHSMANSLAPGDSVQSTAVRRVASAPGTYALRVRHALNPELWTEVRVVVR